MIAHIVIVKLFEMPVMLQSPTQNTVANSLNRMAEITRLLCSSDTGNKKNLVRELIDLGFKFPGALAQYWKKAWPHIQNLVSLDDLIYQKESSPEKGITLLWCLAWECEICPDAFIEVFEKFEKELTLNHFMIPIESGIFKGQTAFWCLANAHHQGHIFPLISFIKKYQNEIRCNHVTARSNSIQSNSDVLWLLADSLRDNTFPFLYFWEKFQDEIPLAHLLFQVQHQFKRGSIVSILARTTAFNDIPFKTIWNKFQDTFSLEDFFAGEEIPGLTKKQAALLHLAQNVHNGKMTFQCFEVIWNKFEGQIKLADLVALPKHDDCGYRDVSLLWYLSVFAFNGHPYFFSQIWKKMGNQILLEHLNVKSADGTPLLYIILSFIKGNPDPFNPVWERFREEFNIENFIISSGHHKFNLDCAFSVLLLQNVPATKALLKSILQQVPGLIPDSYLQEEAPHYYETFKLSLERSSSCHKKVSTLLEEQQLLTLVKARNTFFRALEEFKQKKPTQIDIDLLVNEATVAQKAGYLNALFEVGNDIESRLNNLDAAILVYKKMPRDSYHYQSVFLRMSHIHLSKANSVPQRPYLRDHFLREALSFALELKPSEKGDIIQRAASIYLSCSLPEAESLIWTSLFTQMLEKQNLEWIFTIFRKLKTQKQKSQEDSETLVQKLHSAQKEILELKEKNCELTLALAKSNDLPSINVSQQSQVLLSSFNIPGSENLPEVTRHGKSCTKR